MSFALFMRNTGCDLTFMKIEQALLFVCYTYMLILCEYCEKQFSISKLNKKQKLGTIKQTEFVKFERWW